MCNTKSLIREPEENMYEEIHSSFMVRTLSIVQMTILHKLTHEFNKISFKFPVGTFVEFDKLIVKHKNIFKWPRKCNT